MDEATRYKRLIDTIKSRLEAAKTGLLDDADPIKTAFLRGEARCLQSLLGSEWAAPKDSYITSPLDN